MKVLSLVSKDLAALRMRRRQPGRAVSLSAGGAFCFLVGLVFVSVVVRVLLAREVPAPFVFMDELGYEQMAKGLARSGSLALFGKAGGAYAPLYSVVLAPIYALTRSAPQAYAWAKVANAVLMSLSVFPVYGIARFVLSRPRAVGVAALSLIAPLMFYTEFELSENLAYPLFLVAVWAMIVAVRDSCATRDAAFLVAVAFASAARLQNVALVPAALTAIAAASLVRPQSGRGQALRRTAAAHWLLLVTTAVALLAVLARTALNGGSLPLAGRYANVGSAHANPLRALEFAGQHLAAFDFSLGVIPFAGALVAGYAFVRFGFPSRALFFASVACSVTLWLFLEVGFDAAAFDRPYVQRLGKELPSDASRFHQRYLIYLVPLFLIATVAALRLARPRVRTRVHVVAAAIAALLPLAVPFRTMINDASVADSFGLQALAKNVAGTILPYGHALLIAVIVATILAVAYLYALLRPRPSFAIVMTVCAFLIFSGIARVRIIGASQTIALTGSNARWVDAAVGGGDVALVDGPAAQRSMLIETAFENLSIARVYYTCTPPLDGSFGERRLTLGTGALLRDRTGPLRARYAVVPTDFNVTGRELAVAPGGELMLLEPAGGVLRIPLIGRRAARCKI